MKKVVIFLLSCLLAMTAAGLLAMCGACGGAGFRTASAGRSVSDEYRAAVKILVMCPGMTAPAGIGSGVIVSDRHVLTAYHVVTVLDLCAYSVETFDVRVFDVRVEVEREDSDLARLEVVGDDRFEVSPVAVGPVPSLGSEVCIVHMVPRQGRRCGDTYAHRDDIANDIVHNAVTEPGNSGSGLYDSAGRLVGIVTEYWPCNNGQYCGGRATSLYDRRWIVP